MAQQISKRRTLNPPSRWTLKNNKVKHEDRQFSIRSRLRGGCRKGDGTRRRFFSGRACYPTNAEASKIYTQLILSTFQNMAKPDLASIVTNWGFEDPDLKNRFAHYRTFEALQEVPEERISSSGYFVHRLEASLRAFFTTQSLEQGALKVVNLGDDADTVDAIYGGLTEAFYDVEAIPQEWLDGLQERKVLNNVVEDVLALVQRA
ncbi:MAG: hypothetical protein Q9176_002306 [Flavoplaca citrina]